MNTQSFRAALLAGAIVGGFAGCAEQFKSPDPAPAAKAAAQERARSDLNCEKITTEIVSTDEGSTSVYAVDRREYRVAVRGCGKRTTYTVACTKFSVCSALAERSIIERTE
jgi:hypothetical protein